MPYQREEKYTGWKLPSEDFALLTRNRLFICFLLSSSLVRYTGCQSNSN